MEEIKAQLEDDLKKVTDAVNKSAVADLKKNVDEAIRIAKANFDASMKEFEKQNEIVDWFIDPRVDELRQSKYTALIILVSELALFGVGIFVGMNIG